MNRVIQETRRIETRNNANTLDRNVTWTAARIVYLIAGILESLLAFRFMLSLLGANRGNIIANLIYGITQPFVAPFFGLFNYRAQYGVARFEIETLVAMAVYAFLAWVLVRLLTINDRDDPSV
jgi:YggT family protein